MLRGCCLKVGPALGLGVGLRRDQVGPDLLLQAAEVRPVGLLLPLHVHAQPEPGPITAQRGHRPGRWRRRETAP